MVSSRESLFWKKNTAFSAECKERTAKYPFSLTAFGSSPKGAPFGGVARFAVTTKAVPLGKVASPQAMTEGVSFQPLPLQKRNTGTPAGVPVPRSLNKENQIRLRASSSATRMKSGCSCRMLAGTSGVTGPKKAFLTISALPAPLTTISTLRACMMVRMPMV